MPHFLKKLLGGFPWAKLITCHLMAATMFAAYASGAEPSTPAASNQPIDVDADAETLLRTLAALAREGVPAICNAPYLENRLNIKIAFPRISMSPTSQHAISKVSSAAMDVTFPYAVYGEFSTALSKECYLAIDFNKILLCKASSSRVQDILRERVKYDGPDPGRSALGIFYEFFPALGGSSKIRLGTTENECIHGFSISSEGDE